MSTQDSEDSRQYEGSAFDPRCLRSFSMLPDCDADEAYCVRHEREMPKQAPLLHREGRIYIVADGWGIYSCPECTAELGDAAKAVFERQVAKSFRIFEEADTDTLEGAYRCVGDISSPDNSEDDVEEDSDE